MEKLNIWIAENDLKNACNLKKFLEEKEEIRQVRVFSKGNRVCQILKEEAPDMLVLDTELEDMTGMELLQYLQDQRGTIDFPFIVISSISHHSLIKQAVEYGASFYMLRPYYFERLYQRILK